MKLGYDLYEIECDDIVGMLNQIKQEQIDLYRIKQIEANKYQFYTPIYQRNKIRKYHPTYRKSIGVLYYLLLLVNNKISLIGCITFAFALFLSSQYILDVRIEGTNKETNKEVLEVLSDFHIDIGDKKRSYQELNEIYDSLKDHFKQDIDYLNIYQSGSVLVIKYTNSVGAKKEELSFENLYASKDGVIQKIDVSQGNILVEVNDFVKKGDLLVENTIISTNDETKIIPVKGHIYAYTYQTYVAKLNAAKVDKADAFHYLLFTIRNQIGKINKIDSEKVVEYGIIDKQIVLKMQYVFIEDIVSKGEVNDKDNQTGTIYDRTIE